MHTDHLHGMPLVVVSNREPFIHQWQGDKIVWTQPASGVTAALDPVLRAAGGVWVAHGSGNADRHVVDQRNRVAVPPGNPSYTLKRVWLTPQQEERYYYGLANQTLWPLCHLAYQRPVFEESHWRAYEEVNGRFAEAVAEEIGQQPALVFIQDYHFALLPRILRRYCRNVTTAQFWHIPWPSLDTFRICPWKEEILEGLLGNDLLAFQVQYHCLNFLEAVAAMLEARVDRERMAVTYGGFDSSVRAVPVSVDFEAIEAAADSERARKEEARLCRQYNLKTEFLGVGVDRLDYTKGIPERFRAIGRFLERCPQYRRRFTFFQVAVPTRSHIAAYQQIQREVEQQAEEVNRTYGSPGWRPIVLVKEYFGPESVYALYRRADLCIVSSLSDGMNLVAKEFVSARSDESGVLILSRFTGAARAMDDALLINPYATDAFADAIRSALEMDPDEMARRMRSLRDTVARHDVYRWASTILEKLARVSRTAPSSMAERYEMTASLATA